jgi:hypothetical protein
MNRVSVHVELTAANAKGRYIVSQDAPRSSAPLSAADDGLRARQRTLGRRENLARTVLTHLPKSALGRAIELLLRTRVAAAAGLRTARQYMDVHVMKSAQARTIARNKNRIYSVRHNVASFAMAYAAKLLGVLQRLDSASEFEGTGIRLAPVLRIISAARLAAERNIDRGATLYFTLRDLAPGLEGTSP